MDRALRPLASPQLARVLGDSSIALSRRIRGYVQKTDGYAATYEPCGLLNPIVTRPGKLIHPSVVPAREYTARTL